MSTGYFGKVLKIAVIASAVFAFWQCGSSGGTIQAPNGLQVKFSM